MLASRQQGKHAKRVVERPFILILLLDRNMAPGTLLRLRDLVRIDNC